MKIVINRCFGGFGISDAGHEWLIAHGVPAKAYVEQRRDPVSKRYLPEPANEGFVIFDRTLTPDHPFSDEEHIRIMGRYWESWCNDNEKRTHPLVVQMVKELGQICWGSRAELAVVEVPDDVKWEISEYHGMEHVAEKHRTWR
jgi:hypothetical protein